MPNNTIEMLTQELERGIGIPTDFYYQQDKYQSEIDNIWSKSWLFLCPIHKLKEIGDTVVGRAGNVPVVVVRGRDNKLRGFVNLCRHRGYPVASEDKRCNVLVCKYHAWAYNLDGTLRGAPSEKDEPDFDKGELSLLPVSVDTIGSLVFVNANPNADSVALTHPKLEPYLQSIGFPLNVDNTVAEYELVREIPYEFHANWKLWYDNNTECYHCPTIHASSFSGLLDVNPEAFSYIEIDRFLAYSFDPSLQAKDETENEMQWQHSVQVFPGVGLTVQDDIMLLYQAHPTFAEKTEKTLYCLIRKDADKDRANDCLNVWLQTFAEDKEAIELQQVGIRSGKLPRGRYMTCREPAAIFINKMILAAVDVNQNR